MRLSVLYQARKALENNGLSDVEKDELIKLLDVLILSLEKYLINSLNSASVILDRFIYLFFIAMTGLRAYCRLLN